MQKRKSGQPHKGWKKAAAKSKGLTIEQGQAALNAFWSSWLARPRGNRREIARKFSCLIRLHHLTVRDWDEDEGWLRCVDCGHEERMTGEILVEWIKHRARRGSHENATP